MADPVVAMQLYTLRNECAADCPGTLKAVAGLGYRAVQVSGIRNQKARDIRRWLDGLGLAVAGTHIGLDQLLKEFQATVDWTLDLGTEWAIVAYLPEEYRRTADDWRRAGRLFTELATRLKAEGLRFAYHNHSFEFEKFDGRCAYDLLFEAADPDLVHNEIDTYWVQHGGQSPAAYLRRYAGHIQVVHLKDMGPGPEKPMAPVGDGILDWPAIVQACRDGGTEWLCIEQDDCAPLAPLDAARRSFENCRKWGLV